MLFYSYNLNLEEAHFIRRSEDCPPRFLAHDHHRGSLVTLAISVGLYKGAIKTHGNAGRLSNSEREVTANGAKRHKAAHT